MNEPCRNDTQRTDSSDGSLRPPQRVAERGKGNPMRVALYSHDAMGVGHVRRNLLIAQHLSRSPVNATSLIICGIHEASAFSGGHGIDCLTLPSFEKHDNDDYRPRDLRLSTEVVSAIRTESLKSGLLAMAPQLLLVDKVPRGLFRELEAVLPALRERCGTKVVFGMRDVLDSPERIRSEWKRHDYVTFLRHNYDAIWVYGDPSVFDPIEAYGLQSLREMVSFTGYFDQRERLRYAQPLDTLTGDSLGDLTNTILCMVGGGQDGGELALDFARARFPRGKQGLLITGPLMPAATKQVVLAAAAGRPELRVVSYVPDVDLLMPHVHKVICMGGYNSTMSVVSFAKDALVVPRVHPRQEQLIRAECFERMGLLSVLRPESLSPELLSQWMDAATTPPRIRQPLDLLGLERVASLAAAIVQPRRNGTNIKATRLESTA